MKNAFITGISGQDGSYLAEFLLKKNYRVIGLVRRSSILKRDRIENIINNKKLSKNLILCYGDMCDGSSLFNIINNYKPNEIYNLAAQSHVKISFETPEYTTETIANGTLKLLEAIKTSKLEKKTRLYQASTSEMYGDSLKSAANEKTAFKPVSPYGAAKLYAHNLCNLYKESYGMHISCGILFNHESPRRGENFISQKVIINVIKIKYGIIDLFSVGNLYAKRDWGYAKDYVKSMWKIVNKNKPDNYVISSERSYSVKEFINMTFKKLDIDIVWKGKGINERAYIRGTNKVVVKVDPIYYRPKDINYLQGDSSYAKKTIKWNPDSTSLSLLIDIMIKSKINELKKNIL